MDSHTDSSQSLNGRQRGLLAATIAGGAALRLFGLGDRSLWYDEAASIYLGRFVEPFLTIFDPDFNNEAPLNAALVKLWYGMVRGFTNIPVTSELNDFLIRLLPCLFGIAAIFLVFLVCRRLTRDPKGALIAAFLYAISPFHIYYAQELRVYSILVVWALLGVYFMLRALEENRERDWLAMVFFLMLLQYSHHMGVWIIFSLNLYFLCLLMVRRAHFWRWTLHQVLLILLIAPTLWVAYRMNQIVLGIDLNWYPKPGIKTGFITYKNFFAGYSFTPYSYWPLVALALALALLGLYHLRSQWRAALLIALLMAVPILGNVALWRIRAFSFYEHRLFIFSGVIALFAVATGIRALRKPALAAFTVALFVILTLPSLADLYRHRLHPIETHRLGVFDKVDFRAPAKYLEEHWREGDVLAHSSLFTIYSMKHYFPAPQYHFAGSGEDLPIYLRAVGNEALYRNHGLIPVDGDIPTADAQRVWLIEASGITFDDKPQSMPITEWLAGRFQFSGETDFDGTRLYLYTRGGDAPPAVSG